LDQLVQLALLAQLALLVQEGLVCLNHVYHLHQQSQEGKLQVSYKNHQPL